MSLDKAIQHGKEKRKPYHKAAAVDKSCRPHGDCPRCQGNRQIHIARHVGKRKRLGTLLALENIGDD